MLNKSHSILYNPVQKILNNSRIKKTNKKLNVIFLANLDSHKGGRRLIEIAKHLKNEIQYKINAFGDSRKNKRWFFRKESTLHNLRESVISNNLSDWLEYHGYTDNAAKELISSDILISPSEYNDPWGRNIIEALLGIPVITHGSYKNLYKIILQWNYLKFLNSKDYANSLNMISLNRNELIKWSKCNFTIKKII